MMKLKAADMQLGDVVQTFEGPFSTAIVCGIHGDAVTLQRPYGRVNNVAYGDSVTFLTGTETYVVFTTSPFEYTCWQRGDVK